jgi:hypothetical protein
MPTIRPFRLFAVILALFMLAGAALAQDGRAVVLTTDNEGTLAAYATDLPGDTRFVAFNPADAGRYARIDGAGMLRFVPEGATTEGVYTFSPYFEGYRVGSIDENKLRVDEVAWSPDGAMFAFRIGSDAAESDGGTWFWQPAITTATDPSYQLLRDCPPACALVNPSNAAQWRGRALDWSSDGVAILVGLTLPEEERDAFAIVYASRDPESTQARNAPRVQRFSSAHWAADGRSIVVSGYDAAGRVVYGFSDRTGETISLTEAANIGFTWVQDAVEDPATGRLLMLGSQAGAGMPLALIADDGRYITPLIGQAAPDRVVWNAERSAVLVEIGDAAYVAQTDGRVTDVTGLRGAIPLTWAAVAPAGAARLALPEPIIDPLPAATAEAAPATPAVPFAIGQMRTVAQAGLAIYAQPLAGSDALLILDMGEAVVIVGGPLTDGVSTWWRVQTLDHAGWLPETVDGQPTTVFVE